MTSARSLHTFSAHNSLFPQLIVGPIVRYRDIASQFTPHRVPPQSFADSIRRFGIGLGKRAIIANTVAETTGRECGQSCRALRPRIGQDGAVICYHSSHGRGEAVMLFGV